MTWRQMNEPIYSYSESSYLQNSEKVSKQFQIDVSKHVVIMITASAPCGMLSQIEIF